MSDEFGHFDDTIDDEGMFTVDEEGNPIDPAAEGSFLMAECLFEEGSKIEPYVPDFDGEQLKRESHAFLSRINTNEKEEVEQSSSTINRCIAVTKDCSRADDIDEEHECDSDDDDEYMGTQMSSRVLTDPDDWVLETILKRKMNKEKEGGPWIYLCKWKWHEEPTWETREVMEEAGWIPQLDAFDARGVHQRTVKANKAPKKPHRHYASLIESFFGDVEGIISKVKSKGCDIHHFTKMNSEFAKRFCDAWEAHKDTHAPRIVFHGTRSINLPSIYKHGLIVGGTNGVPIANGSVHGRGVYTAPETLTPKSYARTSSALIVCAGLVPFKTLGASSEVFQRGGYIIFANPAYVFPMWLIQFGGTDKFLTSAPTQIGPQEFFENARHGFGLYPNFAHTSANNSQNRSAYSNCLNGSESRQLERAMLKLQGSNGGFKKSALKAQPRKVKELLAKVRSQGI